MNKNFFITFLRNMREGKSKRVNKISETLNTLSPEAKAEAEAAIAERQADIDAITKLIEELDKADDDKSDELLAKVTELMAKSIEVDNKIVELENKLRQPASVKMQNFVNSKHGAEAFMRAVKNSTTKAEFKENWNAELIKNNISPADALLPSAIIEEINMKWKDESANFLTLLDVTGLKAIKVAYDSNDGDTGRAHGHKKGTQKSDEEITLVPKEIRAQLVYKYITIDRETLDFEDESGALARYIASELAIKVMQEVMRSVLIGDGRADSAAGKVSKIEAIDRAASDAYVTVMQAAADIPTIEEVAKAVDSIDADGDIVVFMSKQTARNISAYKASGDGSVQYRSLEELAMELGVSEIRTTRLLSEKPASGKSVPRVIAFVGKAYKIVGDLTMAGFEDFNLEYNKHEFLTEVYVGGALAVPASGAVVKSKNGTAG